jgi:hypothetical protein
MRCRIELLGAATSMLLVMSGCQFQDLNGDGYVTMDEIVTSIENWACGESDGAAGSGDGATDSGTGGSGTSSTNPDQSSGGATPMTQP